MASEVVIRAGGTCPCGRDRYVRFAVPAVPGLEATISCRGRESAREDVREHPIPPGAALEIRVGVIDG